MKHSVLISARRETNLLNHLTSSLLVRGIFPEALGSELVGSGTVRVRLTIECESPAMEALRSCWHTIPAIQSVVITTIPAGLIVPDVAAE